MPELVEVEAYRLLLERAGLGRRIQTVEAPDAWYLKEGVTAEALQDSLEGRSFVGARRHGKLLLADTDGGPTVGLRFGMTGRLLVDGAAGVDRLVYGSDRDEHEWDRFVVRFDDGGHLAVRDPRRLGGVVLEPSTDHLGPDAAHLTLRELRPLLAASRAPLKAFVMDQSRIAGIGNLIADEALWRAGLDPARETRSLDHDEGRRLHRALRRTVDLLARRGGSHTGDLMPHRQPGGRCPDDGTELVRRTIGGRTTWSCPTHQR